MVAEGAPDEVVRQPTTSATARALANIRRMKSFPCSLALPKNDRSAKSRHSGENRSPSPSQPGQVGVLSCAVPVGVKKRAHPWPPQSFKHRRVRTALLCPPLPPTNFRPGAPVKILDSGFRQNARKKPCPTSCVTVEKGMTRSVTGCYSETSSVQFSRSLSVIVQNWETDALSETASVWMPRINISA